MKKRTTVHIFERGEFAVAWSFCRFLKHHGIDAVVVTKHAVQVRPDQQEKVHELMPVYRRGWDRKQGGAA